MDAVEREILLSKAEGTIRGLQQVNAATERERDDARAEIRRITTRPYYTQVFMLRDSMQDVDSRLAAMEVAVQRLVYLFTSPQIQVKISGQNKDISDGLSS